MAVGFLIAFRDAHFTYLFLNRSTQQAIYDETIRPLVASVLEGYNGCVFAYGQTGTGKTFTMEGKSLSIYAVRYLKT